MTKDELIKTVSDYNLIRKASEKYVGGCVEDLEIWGDELRALTCELNIENVPINDVLELLE